MSKRPTGRNAWWKHLNPIHFFAAAFLVLYFCHFIVILSSVPTLNSSVDCLHHQTGTSNINNAISTAEKIPPPSPLPIGETAAICAIVKDEQKYLEEWVLYNLGLGFSHIYMYDNSATLTTDTWRQQNINTPGIREGTTVVPFPDTSDTRQYTAYRDCMKRFSNHHTWIAIIDVDEFIALYQHDSILSLLKQHCQRGSLAIHWLVFGTSGHVTYQPDEPITKRFQHATDEHGDSFKSIIRVQDYKNITYNHHWVELNDNKYRHDTSGEWVELRTLWSDHSKFSSKRKQLSGKRKFPMNVAVVYHYKYKSVQEYRWKLCDRGDVLNLNLCEEETDEVPPTGDMSITYDRAYQLLLQNVPKYKNNHDLPPNHVMIKPAQSSAVELSHIAKDDIGDASTIFVISMQGTPGVDRHNEGRLDEFKIKWQEACGDAASATRIEHCPGVYEIRRGYGLTLSWLLCLERAKELNLETTVIFEDDARLFDRATTEFCTPNQRHSQLWTGMPKDTFIAFLGGHSWKYPQKSNHQNNELSLYRELSLSYGTYGFAVPNHSLNSLLDTIKGDIVHGFRNEQGIHQHHNFLSPEKSWYHAAQQYNKKIYAVNPLVVWHEGGFSNTWKSNRETITGEEKEGEKGIRGMGDEIDNVDDKEVKKRIWEMLGLPNPPE